MHPAFQRALAAGVCERHQMRSAVPRDPALLACPVDRCDAYACTRSVVLQKRYSCRDRPRASRFLHASAAMLGPNATCTHKITNSAQCAQRASWRRHAPPPQRRGSPPHAEAPSRAAGGAGFERSRYDANVELVRALIQQVRARTQAPAVDPACECLSLLPCKPRPPRAPHHSPCRPGAPACAPGRSPGAAGGKGPAPTLADGAAGAAAG